MNKGKAAFLTIGLSLIILQISVLTIGVTNVNENGVVGSINYEAEEGDRLSWGIFDVYTDAESAEEIESFKAVLDAEVLAVRDLDVDSDNETDIALMTRLVLGTFNEVDISIPAYLDIYTITEIILDIILASSAPEYNITIPAFNAIHYVTSQGATALQTMLNGTGVTESTIMDFLQYLSFFHIGILPTGFNFNLITNLFSQLNTLIHGEIGLYPFSIVNSTIECSINLNATAMSDLEEYLAGESWLFAEPGVTKELKICWDKRINVLNESVLTSTHADIGIIRTMGFKLIRTTMSDTYTNNIESTDFSFQMETAAELYTLKIAMLVLVGICVFNMILVFIDVKNIGKAKGK